MIGMMQHYANPLHIYCRLVGLGISRKRAQKICKRLEPAIRWILYSEKPKASEKHVDKMVLSDILEMEEKFMTVI